MTRADPGSLPMASGAVAADAGPVSGTPGPPGAERAAYASTLPALPVRVVLDPMPTVLTSLVEWFGPLRSRVPEPIRQQAASLARRLDLTPLAVMLADPLGRGCPDFLLRLDSVVPVPTVRDSVALLRTVPEEDARHDVGETVGTTRRTDPSGPIATWQRHPRRALVDLCDTLDHYWYAVLMHVYPDIERRLDRAVDLLRDAIAEVGPQAALASLHPKIRFDLTGRSAVSLPGAAGGRAPVAVTELVIKPMIATRLTLCTDLRPGPGTAAFAVPTPGLTVAATAPTGDPLTLLLGPSRAGLLRRLKSRPATTTGLASASGLGPSTVSHHLGSLRDAGIVAAQRQGQCVLYTLTERGHRLLGVA